MRYSVDYISPCRQFCYQIMGNTFHIMLEHIFSCAFGELINALLYRFSAVKAHLLTFVNYRNYEVTK